MFRTTLIALILASAGPAFAQEKSKPAGGEPAWSDPGPLEELGKKASPLLSWTFDGRGFRFGPETWSEACAELDPSIFQRAEANNFFQHVKKFHAMNGVQEKAFREVYGIALSLSLPRSSVSSSRSRISVTARSEAIEVMARWSGESAKVVCQERRDPRRGLIIERSAGAFTIEIRGRAAEDSLVLRARDGEVRLTMTRGGKALKDVSAKSFLSLYLGHRTLFEELVFPAFARFGAPRPTLPMDPESLAEFLRVLRPIPPDAPRRAAELLAALRSPKLERRQEASGELARGYLAFEAAIREALESDQIGPEERFRLTLMRDRIGGRTEEVRRMLDGGRLLEHPEFRRLLLEAADPSERPRLRRRFGLKAKRYY